MSEAEAEVTEPGSASDNISSLPDQGAARQTEPDTPRKKKLKREINRLRVKLSRKNKPKKDNVKKRVSEMINNVCAGIDGLLPEKTASFVKTQVRLHNKKSKKGIRWTKEDKLFALSVFYHSRKAYSLLCKMFVMPSKTTLLNLLAKTKIYPGFNEGVFEALKQKAATMEEKDHNCVLMFDEMSMKSSLSYNRHGDMIEGFEDFGLLGSTKYVANHALAFMVRGLASKWKQCIGYFLTSGPASPAMLQSLTRQAINKLAAIGLTVKALICDQGSNNRAFIETLEKVNESKPYITHNGSKIFVLYDPPHLLKNVRNNLKKHGFSFKGDNMCWSHIEDFYEFDKSNDIRMAPKLTSAHIDLPPFSPMRVNLAAQVLSSTVAAGLNTLVTFDKLPKEAASTAKMIKQFDSLFNCFNSRSVKSSQPFGHAFSASSGHIEFLKECFEYLGDLSVPSGQKIHCIRGWKISIKALLSLWEDLHTNCGFSFLLTSRLNQDCVENLFSIIRGKGGKRDNPDAREFRAAFRQVVFDQLLVQSKSSNCAVDLDNILLNIGNVTSTSQSESVTITDHEPDHDPATNQASNSNDLAEPCSGPSVDPQRPWVSQSQPIDLPCVDVIMLMKPLTNMSKQNIEAYIAGYLLRRAGFKDCTTCSEQLIYIKPPETELYQFLRNKAYKEENTLVYPTESVIGLIDDLENIFLKLFEAVMHSQGVLLRLCKNAEQCCTNFLTCSNSVCVSKLYYVIKLYMKIRMFHSIKVSNQENKKAGSKRNRKMLKLQHL